jgi:hypothetical protein
MDTNQPTTPITPTTYAPASAAPGMFGTKIPSTVAFVVGILLFLLPFAELKCSGTTIATKSGLDYAMGSDWKTASGMMGKDMQDKSTSTDKMQKGNTQYLAIGALGLAILGLALSFASAKAGGSGGLITGILSAGALIGLMIDEKKNLAASMKNQALDKAKEGADSFGLDKIGNSMNDMKPTLSFSPWFYIAVIAFLSAAFFCYKRMSASKV